MGGRFCYIQRMNTNIRSNLCLLPDRLCPLVRPTVYFSSFARLPNFTSAAHVSFYHPEYSTLKSGLASNINSDAYSEEFPALITGRSITVQPWRSVPVSRATRLDTSRDKAPAGTESCHTTTLKD